MPVVVPLPGQALATLAGHGGSALPRLRDESLASGTSGAPLLLLPPQPRPRAATEAAVVTAGHPSMVILYPQAADGHDGLPAERAGGSDGGGHPALDAGMAEYMPARVHASGVFKETRGDRAGVPTAGSSWQLLALPAHAWMPAVLLLGHAVLSAPAGT